MSAQVEKPLSLDALGRSGPEVAYTVTADAIRAYAAATDDTAASSLEGRIAPPVFAIVPVWEAIAPASRSVATDEARKRVVHYSQDIRIHAPIEAGMRLLSTATPVALLARPNGTSLVIQTRTTTDSGELVNEQSVVEFFRGIESDESRGEPPADHRLTDEEKASPPLAEIGYPVAADQADRYADASGDRFEIHLDDEAAQRVGLPGRILHGFCTLAFVSRAISEATGAGPEQFSRLAARFSAPVFPGGTLMSRIWRLGNGSLGYEAVDGNDRVVLKDGLAELRSQ